MAPRVKPPPPATRRKPTWSGPSSRPSATGPPSSRASAPTTPRIACELARRAEQAGAHGLLVVTPYYSRPHPGRPARALHCRRRCHRAAGDAVRHPAPLGGGHRAGHPARLAEHPRIIAVKDAKGDLSAAREVIADTDLAYYSGDDALNLPWLSVGAIGFVSVIGHVVGPTGCGR